MKPSSPRTPPGDAGADQTDWSANLGPAQG